MTDNPSPAITNTGLTLDRVLERIAEFYRSRTHESGERAAFYASLFEQVLEENSQSGEILPDAWAAVAYVRLELASHLSSTDQEESVQEQLFLALEAAESSENDQMIYRALHGLGHHFYGKKDYELAAVYFQKSLLFATEIWPYNLFGVLEGVGRAWLHSADKFESALHLFDWMILIHPHPMHALSTKYGCLLYSGHKEQVRLAALRKDLTSCQALACASVACERLGRKKRAVTLASRGLKLAEETNDEPWQDEFKRFLGVRSQQE